MKKVVVFLYFLILPVYQVFASGSCFIAKENNKVLRNEGDCATRYAPQSTFKIPLSLIGFDSAILNDGHNPSWSMPDETDPYINVCKGNHNPRSWMRDSCLWYSRILTAKLGVEKFQDYILKFSYGNMDLSGGLANAWISSSLKISPEEQIAFLQKLIDHKFPISEESYNKTKEIMFIQEMAGGWKLYGKTGNGKQINLGSNEVGLQQGWFVGYIEKGSRNIVFVSHVVDNEKHDSFASFRARNEALIKLWYIIDELEK